MEGQDIPSRSKAKIFDIKSEDLESYAINVTTENDRLNFKLARMEVKETP